MSQEQGTIDIASLQFETIFRNQFGVLPADLGLTTSGFSASGNQHTLTLPVVEGRIVGGWQVDGKPLVEHRILARDSRQPAQNLDKLRAALGIS